MGNTYYADCGEGGDLVARPETTETSSMPALLMGATMPQMLENAEKLASNPEYRKEVEFDVRSRLAPGESFWIDELGIGHFWGALHVSGMQHAVERDFESVFRAICDKCKSEAISVFSVCPGEYGSFVFPKTGKCLTMRMAHYRNPHMVRQDLRRECPDGCEVLVLTFDISVEEFELFFRTVVERYRRRRASGGWSPSATARRWSWGSA